MAVRLAETILYVTDMGATIETYTQAFGFTLAERQEWGWALLVSPEGTRVGLLLEGFVKAPDGGYPPPRLSFKTDDLDAELARLRQLGMRTDAVEGSGTMRAATVYDRDGNAIFLWDDGSGTVEL